MSRVTGRVRYNKHGRPIVERVAAKPPVPSYQVRPDADRYQEIQKALADKGYFKGEVNGQWGDDSVDALKRFQTDQKMTDDGKISSLSLIGLGLGPRHDSVSTIVAPATVGTPTVAETNSATPPPHSLR